MLKTSCIVLLLLLTGCASVEPSRPVQLKYSVTYTSTVRTVPVGTLQPRKHYYIDLNQLKDKQ